jgi:hypothetical protein
MKVDQPFVEFVKKLSETPVDRWPIHVVPQWTFTQDTREKCKFRDVLILKFEDLENQYGAFCRQFGIEGELPHENKTETEGYRESSFVEHYDTETLKTVNELFDKDFTEFGYVKCDKNNDNNLSVHVKNNVVSDPDPGLHRRVYRTFARR